MYNSAVLSIYVIVKQISKFLILKIEILSFKHLPLPFPLSPVNQLSAFCLNEFDSFKHHTEV